MPIRATPLAAVCGLLCLAALVHNSICFAAPPVKIPQTKKTATTVPLPPEIKTKFLVKLRNTQPAVRAAGTRELIPYPCVESAELVLQNTVRDTSDEVRKAGGEVLAAFGGSPEVGKYLLTCLEGLITRDRAATQPMTHRLVAALAEQKSPEILLALLKTWGGPNQAVGDLAVYWVMMMVDRRGAEKDLSLVPILSAFGKTEFFSLHYGFRKCVLDAACALEDNTAVDFLVAQLPRLDGMAKRSVCIYLSRISGITFHLEAAKWSDWWAKNRATFTMPAALPPLTNDDGALLYYDIPFTVKYAVFVLDTSESMKAVGGSQTRLAAAQQNLIQAIENLPADTSFGIVAFNTRITVWQKKLCEASDANKKEAIEFVKAQRHIGTTATYDALITAMQMDPRIEAIFFLSDGVPTTGALLLPKDILVAIGKVNTVRRITIHTIGVFGGENFAAALEEFMKKLAAQTGGQFRRVD